MKKIYGKDIDLAKLKPGVIVNLEKHLGEILRIVKYLRKNHRPVSQKKCYVCGSKKFSPYAKIHGFLYVRCARDGHLFTTRRFTERAIQNFYKTNNYYSKTTYADKKSCFYRRDNVAKPKVEFLEKFITPQKGKKIWIDVGAGIGDLVSVAEKKGWEAIGLELSDNSVKFGKKIFGANLVQKNLDQYIKENPNVRGRVDVMSFIGLLEHTINPLGLLRLTNKLLKKNGYVMIQVPSADSFSCMIQSVFPKNVFRQMSPIEHVMLFSQESLIGALKSAGFKPVALWFHGMDVYELLNNLVMSRKNISADSPFYKTIFKHMNELQYVFDRHELSDRIICVAKAVK